MADDVTPLPRSRLVVELTSRANAQLNELVTVEEMNKTTIVNRAIQLYHLVTTSQRNDDTFYIQRTDGTLERIRII